jgi:hypothetical protein
MAAKEGYFHVSSPNGTLALQEEEPGMGITRVYFQPKGDWPGKKLDFWLPTELWENISEAKAFSVDHARVEGPVSGRKKRATEDPS